MKGVIIDPLHAAREDYDGVVKRGADGLAPGDLKTESSKRTLAMPDAVRAAMAAPRRQQAADRLRPGPYYQAKHDLVFQGRRRPADGPPAGPQALQGGAGGGGLGTD
jgi:hypothetical protein